MGDNLAAGCIVVPSAKGRIVLPIINLDIETRSTLHERIDGDRLVKIMPGPLAITGEITTYFENNELYEHFVSQTQNVGRHAIEAVIRLGDQMARNGGLNRSGRKQWRKDRKHFVASSRRIDARRRREAYGLAAF